MTELVPGYAVSDKVQLVRRIGRGGMGEVWLAHHHGLETDVAVKFLTHEHADNPEAAARFKREAAAAAKIKSPHVVQIFDHGTTDDGKPYIVMERLDGEDLASRMHRVGPLPVAFVADVLTQVLKALARAHALGIVHRDVKPENIFLTEVDGERLVKVLDFGIAKRAHEGNMSMTSTGAALGSPYFMSPEQVISAKNVDARSDLWSVGIVAYQAMTGRLPFEGETVGALAIAINDGEYVPPSRAQPGIPAAIDTWLTRVLVKDPAKRFQSAREMSQALAAALTPGLADARQEISGLTLASATTGDLRASIPDALHEALDTTPMKSGEPPSPAMARTHLTATLSRSTTKPKHALVLGIGTGVAAFILLGILIVVISKRHSAQADETPEVMGQPAMTAQVPSGVAAPATGPSVAPVTPEVPPSATPPAPSASAKKKHTGGIAPFPSPTKRKDRGF